MKEQEPRDTSKRKEPVGKYIAKKAVYKQTRKFLKSLGKITAAN